MPAPGPNPPPPRWQDYVLIGVFAVLLGLPLSEEFLHFDPTRPQTENRLLANCPRPPASLAELKTYPARFEAFINDHFGFRNCFILWHNKLNWYVFKEKSTPLVIAGSDGWLFFAGDRMIDHYCGTLRLTQTNLEDWRKLLEHRRDWLATHGIRYVFVIAPDKQDLYPEKLPAWLRRVTPAHRETKLDQFVAYMKTNSTLEILDLRPALRIAARQAPTYQMTDIHWNEFGAYAGYVALMQALSRQQLPGMTPVPAAAYLWTNRPSAASDQAGSPRWQGDLADMLGVEQRETNAVYVIPGPTRQRFNVYLPEDKHIRDLAYVKNPSLTSRAIIYQDSFARFWLPFLGNHFGETDLFWQYQFDAAEILRQKPAVVISEFLESKFNLADPNQLAHAEALP
jgi:hypothetical protein